MDDIITDKRFAHITRDPKFRPIPKIERKIKIDKRFQSMFKDKKFAIKYTIDKRGKPINQTSTENLRNYYELTSSEDESVPETNSKRRKASKKGILKHNNKEVKNKIIENLVQKKEDDSDECISDQNNLLCIKPKYIDTDTDNSSDAIDLDSDLKENEKQLHIKNENLKLTDQVKERLQDLSVNYARGEGVLLTDSSSDEESSEYSGNVLYM